jgi:hypothetical protein
MESNFTAHPSEQALSILFLALILKGETPFGYAWLRLGRQNSIMTGTIRTQIVAKLVTSTPVARCLVLWRRRFFLYNRRVNQDDTSHG